MRRFGAATLGLAFVVASLGPAAAGTSSVAALAYEVISRRPHDTAAFTQGLQLGEDGALFESTGRYGRSSLREVDPSSGQVLRLAWLPHDRFGEGLALVGDRLIQLTWRSGQAFVWDVQTFELQDTFDYEGQGWGLCHDAGRLVMSDGSSVLTFRDPVTFDIIGAIEVTLEGQPVSDLNELECVDGSVWANVWYSDEIMRIDLSDGAVTGVLDLAHLIEPHPAAEDAAAVLNGIAYDAVANSFLVTGKKWPEVVEIRVRDGLGKPD